MFGNNPRLYLVLAWTLVLCIVILSLLPGNSIPKYNWLDLLAIDKIGHFIFYGSTAWSFKKYFILKYQQASFWIIGVSLFSLGVLLESLQYFMHQGRNFDWLDLLANGAGVFCGLHCFDRVMIFISKTK